MRARAVRFHARKVRSLARENRASGADPVVQWGLAAPGHQKASGRPGRGQSQAIRRPVPDNVM